MVWVLQCACAYRNIFNVTCRGVCGVTLDYFVENRYGSSFICKNEYTRGFIRGAQAVHYFCSYDGDVFRSLNSRNYHFIPSFAIRNGKTIVSVRNYSFTRKIVAFVYLWHTPLQEQIEKSVK